ncbi:hypothetical protein BGW80DRAFT_147351 [Lactifluus volemus]|nr:hypothetical protein BGW80DRAFT_147351 [Lactifluus volemus]
MGLLSPALLLSGYPSLTNLQLPEILPRLPPRSQPHERLGPLPLQSFLCWGSGKTVEKCKGKAAAVDMLPRYSEELGAGHEKTTSPAKTTMSPLVLALKNERKVAQERIGSTAAPRNERSNSSGTRPPLEAAKPALHVTSELEDSESDDSDVPLASKMCGYASKEPRGRTAAREIVPIG